MLDTLLSIHRSVDGCARCQLHANRNTIVFGEGNDRAQIMFVGEGPGYHEDQLGRPFVGPAGQLLDKMIGAIGLARSEVYIANIVKCRPPGNRNPTDEEAEACLPILRWQVHIIKPKIIVCLGAIPCRYILGKDFRVSSGRGRWVSKGEMLIMPTFHPAALLRDPAKKRLAWEDFKMVKSALGSSEKTLDNQSTT